jgi:hypothetical protein
VLNLAFVVGSTDFSRLQFRVLPKKKVRLISEINQAGFVKIPLFISPIIPSPSLPKDRKVASCVLERQKSPH